MGRGKGVHAVLGTQGVSDLKKVHGVFAQQILNCVNTIIAHRLNDHESTQSIAQWAGHCSDLDYSFSFEKKSPENSKMFLKVKERFVISPDQLKKQLRPGEAFLMSKQKTFMSDKIKVYSGERA